jgi:NitT/TauT family transport system ATP-binding protein
VLKEIDVPLPRPRVWDAMIENAQFKTLSAQVLQLVRAE